MTVQKSGGHLYGKPVIDYATCFFCGRGPSPEEKYGSGDNDWNCVPLTCPECFTKPENQRIVQKAQKEARKEERKPRWGLRFFAFIMFWLIGLCVFVTFGVLNGLIGGFIAALAGFACGPKVLSTETDVYILGFGFAAALVFVGAQAPTEYGEALLFFVPVYVFLVCKFLFDADSHPKSYVKTYAKICWVWQALWFLASIWFMFSPRPFTEAILVPCSSANSSRRESRMSPEGA
jgi:hypothetical protein